MHHTILWDVHQGGFPDCLRDFFADEKKFKGGVRIGPKGSKLKKQFGVAPVQLTELSIIAHTLGLLSDRGAGAREHAHDDAERAVRAGAHACARSCARCCLLRPQLSV